MMWEELETDLGAASARSMATLLHPRSGILSHVRDLEINGTKEGEDRLKLVIAAIPQDRVRSVWTEFDMGTLTLQLLLLSHRKIEDLCGFERFATPGHSESSDLDSKEHYEWMGPSLLEVLSIHLSTANRLESVSRCCPKITTLSLRIHLISASGGTGTSLSALFNHLKEAPLFPNLTVLRLWFLNIASPEGQTVCKSLNLSKVRTLELVECYPFIPLLDSLSPFYTDNTGDLNELSIAVPTPPYQAPESIQAVEKLLRACPQLESLQLDLSQHGFVAKDCILAHCQTLIKLWISTGVSSLDDHLSAEDMGSILGACNKLNELAMNMPSLGAGASLDAEFVNMLVSSPPHIDHSVADKIPEWHLSKPQYTGFPSFQSSKARVVGPSSRGMDDLNPTYDPVSSTDTEHRQPDSAIYG